MRVKVYVYVGTIIITVVVPGPLVALHFIEFTVAVKLKKLNRQNV